MCATDVDPTRLSIAQEAALEFIDAHAETNRIGLVAFAGFAELIVPPTNDKEVLLDAVRNLTTSIGTAIGSATLESIDAIAGINEAVARSGVDLGAEGGSPVFEDGFFLPDIIVLLTDGANSRGPDPVFAALQAADRGLRVYTIGFGTTEPTEMVCTASQLGGDLFDDDFGFGGFGGGSFGGFGGGFRRFLLLDEPTLMTIADVTGGEYYRAESASQLFDVFEDLPAEIVLQKEMSEISVYFAAAGAAFAALAFLLSIRWFRIP
jgi:Ca-activated chloride channel family protein